MLIIDSSTLSTSDVASEIPDLTVSMFLLETSCATRIRPLNFQSPGSVAVATSINELKN